MEDEKDHREVLEMRENKWQEGRDKGSLGTLLIHKSHVSARYLMPLLYTVEAAETMQWEMMQ